VTSIKTATFDPIEFATQVDAAARAAQFRVDQFGEAGGYPLLALTKRTPGPRPRIYLSAGIHGDEPAPPHALLELIEAGAFDSRAVWFVCPMLNPVGLAGGTRANGDGIDLNRDYKDSKSAEIRAHIDWLRRQPNFDLTICIHEDYESTGFYLYEQNPDGRPSLADTLVAAAARHCPIDMSPMIDEREAHGGIIRPVGDPLEREKWPESIYLRANHTRLAYTVETPSSLPLAQRVATLREVVSTALELTTKS
jgi:predicted deacylase